MPTIRDVAKESGVSVTTVSFVLNNSDRPVSMETRRRVREVARRMNYYPNAAARGLVRRKMWSLGVLMPAIEAAIVTNHYAVGVLSGIFAESAARGYDIHLHTRPWVDAETSAARVQSSQTDGTLVVAPTIGSDIVSGLHALNLSMVVVSTPTALAGVPYVDVDNTMGARLATEHLIALGHTRIAHLMGERNQHWVFERRDCFVATLAAHGIAARQEYLAGDSFLAEPAYAAARELLTLPEPPTAVFAANDDLAVIVLRAARDLGVAVPEQLSVVGFDDYPVAKQMQPGLTTVKQPLWEIGVKATQILIARIEEIAAGSKGSVDEKVREREAHLFAPEIIARGSTAAVPTIQ